MWLIDLVGNFRPQILIVVAMVLTAALMLRLWKHAIAAVLVLVAGLYLALDIPIAPQASTGTGGLRLVGFNLKASDRNITAEIDWLLEGRFDVVALYEVTPAYAKQLERLSARFPHSVVEPRATNYGMAVFSIHPLQNAQVFDPADAGVPAIRALLAAPQGGTEILVLHPPPPVGAHHAEWRNSYLDRIAYLPPLASNRVAIGDLNATPWSVAVHKLHRFGGFSFASRFPPTTWPTRFFFPFTVAIDHALVAGNVQVVEIARGPKLGSDHWPIVLTLKSAKGEGP